MSTSIPERQTFTFHSDAGHGWLEVDRAWIAALGLSAEEFGYSYQRQNSVYLEEDCDAGKFMNAYKERFGEELKYVEKYMDNSFIKELGGYRR